MAETEKLLANKLENISADKIVPPEPYIAVPALQAISYSMNNSELRNLYANLIAKSMNTDTKDTVHPAYVEIIKQLSSFDAILLKKLSDTNLTSFGIIKIRLEKSNSNNQGFDWISHIISPNFGMNLSNFKQYAVSLENLQRLQLIHIDYTNYLINDSIYREIESGDIITKCRADAPYTNKEYQFFKCLKGILRFTSLGQEFNNICIGA